MWHQRGFILLDKLLQLLLRWNPVEIICVNEAKTKLVQIVMVTFLSRTIVRILRTNSYSIF